MIASLGPLLEDREFEAGHFPLSTELAEAAAAVATAAPTVAIGAEVMKAGRIRLSSENDDP